VLLTAVVVLVVRFTTLTPCRNGLYATTAATTAATTTVVNEPAVAVATTAGAATAVPVEPATAAVAAAAAVTTTAAAATVTAAVATAAAATTAVDTSMASAALRVVLAQSLVPRELWSVTRAAHNAARQTEPITVSISSGMSVGTMQSLLQRTTLTHVSFDAGCEQAPAMAAALTAALRDRRAHPTLQYTALTAFTLSNFRQLNSATLNPLMAALPVHVSALSLLLQPSEADRFNADLNYEDSDDDDEVLAAQAATRVPLPIPYIPSTVQSLTVQNISQMLQFMDASKATELHIVGICCCCWALPASLRTITVRRALVEGYSTFLPDRIPHGVQVYDVSESDIVKEFNFCDFDAAALPDSITVLKLPHGLASYSGHIPTQLEVLDTGYCFNSPLSALPATLKELYIKRRADDTQQYEHELGELPDGLKVLHVANMTHSLGVLPDTLEVLHCTNHSHELGMLPISLKVLKIEGSNFNHSLGLLPDGLVELDLSTAVDFQQPLGVLPQSLKTIKLHGNYRFLDNEHVLAAAAAAAAAAPHAIAEVVAAVAAAAPPAAAAVVEAVIDETVQNNSTKRFKCAAVTTAAAAAAVTAAALYGAKLMVICYLLQSI
jgi:hypothetical protein